MTQVNTTGEKQSINENLTQSKKDHYEKLVHTERKKYSWYKKADDTTLSKTYPNATPAERLRFLVSRDGNLSAASTNLGEYLKWKEEMGLLTNDTNDENSIVAKKDKILASNPDRNVDDILWYFATSIAYAKLNECNLKDASDKTLPRIMSMADGNVRTLDGHRIIQFLGARVDLELASQNVYALAGAIFVDLLQDRHSMEKFVVMIDARAGRGWRNHPASQLVSFSKNIANLLSAYQPERMKTTFLFPIPYIANALWYCVKPFLDSVTAEKIKLFSGSSGIDDPTPKDLKKYFSEDVINYLEKSRVALFTE